MRTGVGSRERVGSAVFSVRGVVAVVAGLYLSVSLSLCGLGGQPELGMRGRGLVVLLRTARELSARVSSLDSWQAGRHARVRRSYRWMPDGGWQWCE